jgi:bacillithiol biosynthesis cysteine-adding enzyme BshC
LTVRFLETPLSAGASGDPRRVARLQAARRRDGALAAALLADGAAAANVPRLLAAGSLAVTTGQQAGLFTGPLYAIHKALSAAALAKVMGEKGEGGEREIVPVFWVAGDDHDFAEINHCWVIGQDNKPAKIVLRERAAEAPMLPTYQERVGRDGAVALARLEELLPPGDARSETLAWLARSYAGADISLAEANARAMSELLGPFGVVVARGWSGALKRAARGVFESASSRVHEIDEALAARARELKAAGREIPVEVGDGLSLLMLEGAQGRDRLRLAGDAFVTRRGNERVARDSLTRVLDSSPELLSANVLLRPVVEAAVFPTVAYFGGPGELAYLEQADPLFALLGIPQPARLPRLSGLLIESKVDKVLEKYQLAIADLARDAGGLASQVARASLPAGAVGALAELRGSISERYAALQAEAMKMDRMLERPLTNLRNQALVGSEKAERKLVRALKRQSDEMLQQVMRARNQLYPDGHPQERTISAVSFLARHGRAVLDQVFEAACAHARRLLEAPSART